MPHDANGNPIRVGDVVTVRCEVLRVDEGEEYCNVALRTMLFMPPYTEGTGLSLNTKQVETTGSSVPLDDTP